MITIKSGPEIELMRKSGRLVFEVLELMSKSVRPGVTTRQLDKLAYDYITSHGARPSFLHYNGYPASICASVDEMVVHGIPSNRALKEGEIVGIDVGAELNGFHGDAARTFCVGEVSPEKRRLIEVTKRCFFEAMKAAVEGNRLVDVARAVQTTAESEGFSVVRALTGHGIGRKMHEDPSVLNYVTAGEGMRLREGMTLAVEPMINAGVYDVKWLDDGWGVVTADGKPSAHYENTIVIRGGGQLPELLTLPKDVEDAE